MAWYWIIKLSEESASWALFTTPLRAQPLCVGHVCVCMCIVRVHVHRARACARACVRVVGVCACSGCVCI